MAATTVERSGEKEDRVGARRDAVRRLRAGRKPSRERAIDPARRAAQRQRTGVVAAGDLETLSERRDVRFDRRDRVGLLAQLGAAAFGLRAQRERALLGIAKRALERLARSRDRLRDGARDVGRRPRRGLPSRSAQGIGDACFGERADALASGRNDRVGQAGDGDAAVEEALVAARAAELRNPLEGRPQDGDRGDDEHQLDDCRNARHPAHAGPCGQARQGGGQHRRQAGSATTTRLRRLRAPAGGARRRAEPDRRAGGERRRLLVAALQDRAVGQAQVDVVLGGLRRLALDLAAGEPAADRAEKGQHAPLVRFAELLAEDRAGDRAADRTDDAAARRHLDGADRFDDGAVAARRGLGGRRRRGESGRRRRAAAAAASRRSVSASPSLRRPTSAPASPSAARTAQAPPRAWRRRPTAPFPWREEAARRARHRRPRRASARSR